MVAKEERKKDEEGHDLMKHHVFWLFLNSFNHFFSFIITSSPTCFPTFTFFLMSSFITLWFWSPQSQKALLNYSSFYTNTIYCPSKQTMLLVSVPTKPQTNTSTKLNNQMNCCPYSLIYHPIFPSTCLTPIYPQNFCFIILFLPILKYGMLARFDSRFLCENIKILLFHSFEPLMNSHASKVNLAIMYWLKKPKANTIQHKKSKKLEKLTIQKQHIHGSIMNSI